jgi:CBS-domain-containing membrane protein
VSQLPKSLGLESSKRESGWRLFDAQFREYRAQYFKQTAMATVSMLGVLLLLDLVDQTVLIASLGASTFIVFSMPHTKRSRPRYLVGGYIVGAIAGCSLSLLADRLDNFGLADPRLVHVVCAALALGLAFLIMVVTDTEHPPAAALALGFVLNEWDTFALLVVLCGIVLITAIKESIKSRLRDLI